MSFQEFSLHNMLLSKMVEIPTNADLSLDFKFLNALQSRLGKQQCSLLLSGRSFSSFTA